MDKMCLPLFVLALVLIVVAVLAEVGSSFLLKAKAAAGELDREMAKPEYAGMDRNELAALNAHAPPGMGIPRLAFVDGLLAFTALLMGLPYLLSDRLQGKLVGLTSTVVSFLVLVAAIVLIFVTLAKVLLMISLFVAVPFGTMAYLALWGFFDRTGASIVLGLLLLLKLGFVASLIFAQQRFIQNKGLLLLLLTSLLANLIVSFLHGVVPRPLVSITDGIAALVVLILAAIWALLMLIFGVISIVKAIA